MKIASVLSVARRQFGMIGHGARLAGGVRPVASPRDRNDFNADLRDRRHDRLERIYTAGGEFHPALRTRRD